MEDITTNQNVNGPEKKKSPVKRIFLSLKLWLFLIAIFGSLYMGQNVAPTWTVEKISLDIQKDDQGKFFYTYKGKPKYFDKAVAFTDSRLHPDRIDEMNSQNVSPEIIDEYVFESIETGTGSETLFYHLKAKRHWGILSLLPAIVAIVLCWVTREPLTSLLGGIVSGALLLGYYDITDAVLVESFASRNAAGILLLYLCLLGGLMGIWSRTGAAQAFAELMTRHVVRGPRTAKLVAWFLGIIFFQGGTISTVLVGTTVKPIADKEKISHEELSYIVDSTASPIASQLAFNAWPGYIQAFIFVAGVPWLVTESDRITFFFKSVPFCFYAIFAVMFTFLLSIGKSPFLGKKMRDAISRARQTGQLDEPGSEPLSSPELQASNVPPGYTPHVIDFFVPLLTLIGIAIGTFIYRGSPQVRWAFSIALILAVLLALMRGMSLIQVMDGFVSGLKGVVLGAIILLLAITIGGISKEAGGGIFLVNMLGDTLPFWLLPVMLQIMTIIIAFSTGTSWGTYAVSFPLAMPLAWAVANAQGLSHPEFYMTICFAAVMDGSVYGDQCSPISDTTVLSSMCTGCDLMDHVKTQIPQASFAALLAGICWTAVSFFAA